MKNETLKVGSKKSGDRFYVSASVNVAETDADVANVCKSEAIRVACFNRGWRIRLQETSGAREFVSALTAKARDEYLASAKADKLSDNETFTSVQRLVNDYVANPDAERKSGRPTTPKEVKVDPTALGLSKKAQDKMREQFAASGVVLTFTQD